MPFVFTDIAITSYAASHRENPLANEDMASGGQKALVLMDGTTPLLKEGDYHFFVQASDTAWMSYIGCISLCQYLNNTPAIDTIEAIDNLLREMRSNWERTVGRKAEGLSALHLPSATVSCVRLRTNDVLELFWLADSPISIKIRDGKVLYIAGDEQWLSVSAAAQAHQREIAHDMSLNEKERARAAAEVSMDLRWRANTGLPDGYEIFCFCGEENIYGCERTLNAGDVESICIYSDGYAEILRFDETMTVEGLHEMSMSEAGQRKVIECLREFQRADSSCSRVPRAKPEDDATVIAAHVIHQSDVGDV